MALRVVVQLDSKMESPSKDSASLALMHGLLGTWPTYAIYASGQNYSPRASVL